MLSTVVIRATDSEYNFWSGVLGEPGSGRYLEVNGSQNTVIGHDNCPHASAVNDKAFIGVSQCTQPYTSSSRGRLSYVY